MKIHCSPLRLIVTASLLCFLQQRSTAAILIDEMFTPFSTTTTSFIQPIEDTNFSYAEGDLSGDDTLLLQHVHDSERDEDDFPINTDMLELASLVRVTNVSYTPSVSGVIDTLSFRIDLRTTDPFDEVFFFIERGPSGRLGGWIELNAGDLDGEWKTLEVLGLTDADFGGLGLFSSSEPLRFGFGFVSSAMVDEFGFDPVTYQVELDRFQVSVIPIPEPNSALLLIGAGLLAARRNRPQAT